MREESEEQEHKDENENENEDEDEDLDSLGRKARELDMESVSSEDDANYALVHPLNDDGDSLSLGSEDEDEDSISENDTIQRDDDIWNFPLEYGEHEDEDEDEDDEKVIQEEEYSIKMLMDAGATYEEAYRNTMYKRLSDFCEAEGAPALKKRRL